MNRLFLTIAIVIPLLVYWLLPLVVELLISKRPKRNALLIITCVCFLVSWFVPSPLIHGKNTSFSTHLIGGGIFSGFLWLYLKETMGWKSTWIIELISLLALVSLLGVANELFELFLVEFHITRHLSITDTSWDLLANTLGALLFWVGYNRWAEFRSHASPPKL